MPRTSATAAIVERRDRRGRRTRYRVQIRRCGEAFVAPLRHCLVILGARVVSKRNPPRYGRPGTAARERHAASHTAARA